MEGVFLFLGFVGFLFMVISAFFGHEVGHEGLLDGIFDALHIDHADHGDAGTGASIFSTFAMSFFLMGFGGAGWVSQNYFGLGPYPSVGVATFIGACLWVLAFLFMEFMYSQQADSTIKPENIVGKVCTVTVSVAPGGLGKIQCQTAAGTTELLAVLSEEEAEVLPSGTSVRVVSFAGDRYVVERYRREVKA